ncbi:MAG: sigma-70 family RNA polymerase sigma factor [Actinomycetota bacterium]|nr:sigma-70 family RNA polymerase sigma factor [Actinomycetota bacterium]
MWRELFGFVYRDLRRRGIPHADAEDLAQEVLEAAWAGLDAVDPGRLHAWLRAVARNKLADRARYRRPPTPVAELPEAIDPAPGPDESAVRSAERRALASALARLSERDRRLIEACHFEERPLAEAAESFGMTVNATKVALHRARARLRRELESTGGIDE